MSEYVKKAAYVNSDPRFMHHWSTNITFPITKKTLMESDQTIGFLCITSITKLNNTKKNVALMKLLPEIAEGLALILTDNSLVIDE